jgi:hypothetical protein
MKFELAAKPSKAELSAMNALRSLAARWAAEVSLTFVIGAPALAQADAAFAHAAFVAEDAFAIRQVPVGDGLRVLMAGRGQGVLYAAYAWLERQGWSFHLHGDVEPDDGSLDLGSFAIERQPRFAWRGLQLWNYWWPGRDSWGLDDYVAYLDQFPKMGLNHFDFPLYWYEPLFTGVRFADAAMRRLRLSGVDVGLARVGGEHLSGRGRFTSTAIPEDASDEERTEAARTLLRRVLAHARGLGLRTTIGIEPGNVALVDPSLLQRLPAEHLYERNLLVQPSSDSGVALARARLEALFSSFPDVDVYSLWQSEMGPWRSTAGSPHPADVAFRRDHDHLADRLTPGDFDQLQWLRNCALIAEEIKPGVRLSTGGWGAERLMMAADEVLPDHMIRATIADYEPAFGLRRQAFKAYGETQGERCHTTWSEVDQHLWIQQVKITDTARVLDALEVHGVEGASLLHWRVLFNDPDLYCFARGCWTGSGSAEELRMAWAKAKFGADAAGDVARALSALEAFNAGIVARTPDILHSAWWVGFDCFMSGLLSANRYLDGTPIEEKFFAENVDELIASGDEADTHLSAAVGAFEAAGQRKMTRLQAQRLGFWHNRAVYSRDLYRAHVLIARAVRLASASQDQGSLKVALGLVASANAEQVVKTFAERLGEGEEAERGELGLLLSLNVKFLGSAKRIEAAIRRLVERPPAAPAQGVLDARAGLNLPRRVYQTFFELLHVATGPWCPESDEVHAQAGFGLSLVSGAVGRLSPTEGVWSDPEKLVLRLSAPAGWRGVLDLYFYQELDWDTPFRVQDVLVGGRTVCRLNDFFGRGEDCNEGIWQSVPVVFPSDGTLDIACVRLGGGDARLSRLVLRSA